MLALLIVAAATAVPSIVMADGTCEPGVICLKPYTVYGRVPKPLVVIELRHASAATAAGAAHEDMRSEWIEKLEPATLRSH
jgi:hypothetical protein